MKYAEKELRRKRDAGWSLAIVGAAIIIFAAYSFLTRMAIGWDKPEYEVSTYRNKDAQIIGHVFELELKYALYDSMCDAADEAYIETAGGKKRAPYHLQATFRETFAQDLVVQVTTRPASDHTWERKFTRTEVTTGIEHFGAEVGNELAGLR
jgi:hypothetical protein